MAIAATIESNSKVHARSGRTKDVGRQLGEWSSRAGALYRRRSSRTASQRLPLAQTPVPPACEVEKTASATAIPETAELPGRLIEAQRKRIFYFILKHVNNHHDAEDLTQEALLQAYLSFASFQGQSSFSTWITGIALNLVRNHVNRAPQRRYCFVDEEVLRELASDRGDPVAEVHLDHLLERVEQQLPKLPAQLREVLVLVAANGLSYEEVAATQQTTVENVKNRLFRARQALRKTALES